MSDITNSKSPIGEAINANQLRRLAEWADGKRGEDFVLSMRAPLRDGTVGFGLKPLKAGETPDAGDIAVRTDVRAKEKQTPREVVVHHPDGTLPPIIVPVHEYDAIFWGEVSAEKFLVPYYVRFLDAAQMEKLQQAIVSPSVIAIAHMYPTFFDTVQTTIQPALLVATRNGFVDNGFIRLSDWTETEQ